MEGIEVVMLCIALSTTHCYACAAGLMHGEYEWQDPKSPDDV